MVGKTVPGRNPNLSGKSRDLSSVSDFWMGYALHETKKRITFLRIASSCGSCFLVYLYIWYMTLYSSAISSSWLANFHLLTVILYVLTLFFGCVPLSILGQLLFLFTATLFTILWRAAHCQQFFQEQVLPGLGNAMVIIAWCGCVRIGIGWNVSRVPQAIDKNAHATTMFCNLLSKTLANIVSGCVQLHISIGICW